MVTPPKKSGIAWAIGLLCLVQMSFACNALLGRVYMKQGTNPVVLSFFRDISAATIMLNLAWMSGQWYQPQDRADLLRVTVTGLMGVSGSQVLFLVALKFVQPSTVTLFQILIAVFTPLVAALFGYEQFFQDKCKTFTRLSGLLTCVAGAGADMLWQGASEGSNVAGSMVLVIQVTCGAVYAVMMKNRMLAGWPPLALVAWSYAIGCLGLLPLVGFVPRADWELSAGACGVLLYSILMTSVFNYVAMAVVNDRLGSTMVTAFFPLQPIFTALGQPFFGLRFPTVADLFAACVVGAGLALFLKGEATSTPNNHGVATER